MRNKGFRSQKLRQAHMAVVGLVPVPQVRLWCEVKASAAKGCAKPRWEQGNGGRVVGQVLVPQVRLWCGIKVSAVKGCAKPTWQWWG